MKAELHPKTIECIALCANCGRSYRLIGNYQSSKLTIEQCSSCHQAYTGIKQQQSKGASENFYSKFKFNLNKLNTKPDGK